MEKFRFLEVMSLMKDGVEEEFSSREEIIKRLKQAEPGSTVSIYNSNDYIFEADICGFGKDNITLVIIYINDIGFTEEELGLPVEVDLWDSL